MWGQNYEGLLYGNAQPSNNTTNLQTSDICDQIVNIPDDLTNGAFLGGNTDNRVAVDVPVEQGVMMTINQIKVSLARASDINYVHFRFLRDNDGIPGDELLEIQDTQIVAEDTLTYINSQLGYLRTFTVDLDTPVVLHGNTSGRYWMEVLSDARAWGASPYDEDAIGFGLAMKIEDDEWFTLGLMECLYEIHADCDVDNGEPDYPCFQGDISNEFEDGYGIDNHSDESLMADDFIVEEGSVFNVHQVKLNVMVMQGEPDIEDVTLNFRADNGGIPGEILQTIPNIQPSVVELGNAFDIFTVYQLTLNLPETEQFEAGHYWLQPVANTSSANWEITSLGTNGELAQLTYDGGETWNSIPYQAVFYIAGECENAPSEDSCSQEFTGEGSIGVGIVDDGTINRYHAANDINVAANTQFEVQKVTLNVVTLEGEPTTFDVTLYEDNNGPGEELANYQVIVPSSVTIDGEFGESGQPVYKVELSLPTPYTLTATSADTKYWIGVNADLSELSMPVFWVSFDYSEGSETQPAYQSEDGGETWSVYVNPVFNTHSEGFMQVEGQCEYLGINDVAKSDFNYYPNPVTNTLTIDSQKNIKSVAIFNLVGQNVQNKSLNTNKTELNLSTLSSGVYLVKTILENGQIETFKIIKK